MLKICENLPTLPLEQIGSNFKNLCAHQEAQDKMNVLRTKNIKKYHLGYKVFVNLREQVYPSWLTDQDFGTYAPEIYSFQNLE